MYYLVWGSLRVEHLNSRGVEGDGKNSKHCLINAFGIIVYCSCL